MATICLSLSRAISDYSKGKLKVRSCAWIVSNTKHTGTADMFDSYKSTGYRPNDMNDEEFMGVLEVLWPKLVQPRVLEGPNCGHYSGSGGYFEVPDTADISTPAAAIQAMRDWQMLNGWYEDAASVRHSMHDKDGE